MTWHYQGKEFNPDEDFLKDYQGFVYCLTNNNTGKKYIGKKFFWSQKTLPITKTRKRRKKVKVISDWMKYYGSSGEVKVLLEDGVTFYREILRLCKTKGECSYYEMKEQIERDVLLKPEEYYNAFVGGKIHRRHLI